MLSSSAEGSVQGVLGGGAGPVSAAGRLLRRQRTIMRWALAIGLALFIGGFTGFGIYGTRQQDLLRNGARTTAIVISMAPYTGGSPFNPSAYNEHINVEFNDQSGRHVVAPLGIGESDPYRIGESVGIAYNRRVPTEAVFAKGSTDIGSAGFWFFSALTIGLALVIFGAWRLYLCGRARHALTLPPRTGTVSSELLPRGRYQKWAISISADTSSPVRFWSWSKEGCSLLGEPTQMTVFGQLEPRSVVVAVEPKRLITVAGRIPRRWRDPKRRRRR